MGGLESADFLARVRELPELDIDFALGNIDGSEQLYIKVFRRVVHQIPKSIALMDEALSDESGLPFFATKAHGIRGTLNQIGCLELAKAAEELETAAKAKDKLFCVEHYGALCDKLRGFYERAALIIEEADASDENTGMDEHVLQDFAEALKKAKNATDDYDSMAASEMLEPLRKLRFNKETDTLLSDVFEALDAFKSEEASEYISKLLEICEQHNQKGV